MLSSSPPSPSSSSLSSSSVWLRLRRPTAHRGAKITALRAPPSGGANAPGREDTIKNHGKDSRFPPGHRLPVNLLCSHFGSPASVVTRSFFRRPRLRASMATSPPLPRTPIPRQYQYPPSPLRASMAPYPPAPRTPMPRQYQYPPSPEPPSPPPRLRSRSPPRTLRIGVLSPPPEPLASPSSASPAESLASPVTPVEAFLDMNLNNAADLGTRLAVLLYEVVRLKRVASDIANAIADAERQVIEITEQLTADHQGQEQGQAQVQQGQEPGQEQGQGGAAAARFSLPWAPALPAAR